MLKWVPNISKEEIEVMTGESNMEEHKSYPLKLPYLVVFICMEGRAVVNVKFKNSLLKLNDILVLSEDSITVFLRRSKDFRLFYLSDTKTHVSSLTPNYIEMFFGSQKLNFMFHYSKSRINYIYLQTTTDYVMFCKYNLWTI